MSQYAGTKTMPPECEGSKHRTKERNLRHSLYSLVAMSHAEQHRLHTDSSNLAPGQRAKLPLKITAECDLLRNACADGNCDPKRNLYRSSGQICLDGDSMAYAEHIGP